jgi:hypothetical protein
VKFSPKEVRALAEGYVAWVMRSPDVGPASSVIESMGKRDWTRYVESHEVVIGRILQFLESEGYEVKRKGASGG